MLQPNILHDYLSEQSEQLVEQLVVEEKVAINDRATITSAVDSSVSQIYLSMFDLAKDLADKSVITCLLRANDYTTYSWLLLSSSPVS